MQASIDDAPDYGRKWYIMSAVAMAIFLATIDSSIVNVALPTLTEALNTDFASIQWVVLSYLLVLTTLQAIIGRLADMYGRKRLYNSGFVIFTIGSFLCGLAPTVGWLIGFRVIQGVGGALCLALGLAIITDAFPPNERGRALGIGGAIVSIGIVAGPTLGGVIIENLSWHWIFFVNVPIGILGTYLTWRNVPESHPPGGQQFDLAGAATLSGFLLTLMLGLTIGQHEGFGSAGSVRLFIASAVLFAAFMFIQTRHPQPIIDLRLFDNLLFRVNMLTGMLIFVSLGILVLLPFYLEMALGYSVQQVGLLLAVMPIGLGITAPMSGFLSDRFGTRPISVIGLGFVFLAMILLSTLTTETTAIGFMLRYLPVGIGVGFFQSPNNSAIMGNVPRERLGVTSSLLAITRSMGETIGFAVLGAVWAALVVKAAGGYVPGGAEAAPPEAIAAGLRGAVRLTAGLVGVGFLAAVYAWYRERHVRVVPVESASSAD